GLLNAHNPDVIEEAVRQESDLPPSTEPTQEQKEEVQKQLARDIAKVLTPQVRDFVESARKAVEQIIDNLNLDTVLAAGWDNESISNAENVVEEFQRYIEQH